MLKVLGLSFTEDRANNILEITGCGGKFEKTGKDVTELFLGNAGTAMRPLTAAVAAAGQGTFVLDGVERQRETDPRFSRRVSAIGCRRGVYHGNWVPTGEN